VNGILTERGKRSFEWSSNWKFTETSSRAGRLRERRLELDGYENVFSNWTVILKLSGLSDSGVRRNPTPKLAPEIHF